MKTPLMPCLLLLACLLAATALPTRAAPDAALQACAGQPALSTQADAERYIRASADAWAASVATGDDSVVRRILADDVVWVLDGRVLSKATAVAEAATGPGPFLSNATDYVHVRFFGTDTAVAQGSETWTKTGNRRGRFVWTDTWVRRGGCWKIVNSQDTIVPLPPTTASASQAVEPAEGKASDVSAAASDPRIAAVLAAVDAADTALVQDDHAAFAALLAPDLVVNNPQNGVSVRGATGRRNAAGLISYSRYERSIEYAGKLGEFVVLMGDERVVPKGDAPEAGKEVRRRFTDIWKQDGARWVLAARQATIVVPAKNADPAPAGAADAPHEAHRDRVSCQPLGQHQVGDVGCHIVAQEPIHTVPAGPLYWHLDTFPDSAAARAARGANGSIVEAYGQVWLLTVAGKRWQPKGGHHVATIGPFKPLTTGPQTAAYMVATSTANMDSPPHAHPGPEAFYVVEGEQCLETPDGVHKAKAGEGLAIAGGVPMKLYGAGDTLRKALVLVLHDAAQPVVIRNPDWQPTDACLAGI